MQALVICLLLVFSGTVAPRSSLPQQDRLLIRLRQLIDVVEQLGNFVNDLDPELLPAPENVKKAQLKPADAGDNQKTLAVLTRQLTRKLPATEAGRTPKQSLTCPSCDSYKKKPPKEFLERLRSLIQKMIHQRLSQSR
ncbi:interleukin-21 isoform 2-T2 [Molossus nigricans]